MRRHAGTLALFLALSSGACVERDETPRSAPEPPRAPAPPTSSAPSGAASWGCTLGAPRTLLALPSPPARVAAALGEDGGWVVADRGWESALALPVGPDGAARGDGAVFATPAESLPVHAHAAGRGLLVLLEGPCVVEEHGQRCLHAVGLDPEGAPIGRARTVPMGAPLHTLRRRGEGNVLWLARSQPAGPPVLDRFALGSSGVTHRGRVLGRVHDPGARASEVLGLATEGDRWAVVWRFGAVEDPASEVVLTTDAGETTVEPLHHALVLDSFAFDGEDLALVAAFEFSRAHFMRLGLDGALRTRPLALAPGAPVPPPFTGRTSLHLVDDGVTLALRRSDGAGDRAGPDLPIHPHPDGPPTPAAVAREGGRAFVVYVTSSDDGYHLASRALRCPDQAPPSTPMP